MSCEGCAGYAYLCPRACMRRRLSALVSNRGNRIRWWLGEALVFSAGGAR